MIASFAAAGQTPANRRIEISSAAANLLQQADIARQAAANHDVTGAREHAQQALAAAAKIQQLAGSPPDPLVVPIYIEFESISTMVPAKRHGSADRLKHNASVSEVTGDYTATSLNVSSAHAHLQAGLAALDRIDTNAAGADFSAVQADVSTKTYSGQFPLVRARENLALARTRAMDNKYKDAVLPLKSAARALNSWAHQKPTPKVADVAARLSVEMDAYAERIAHDHGDAVNRITAWWDQVTDWFNSGMTL